MVLQLHTFRFALKDFLRRAQTGNMKAAMGGVWALINGVIFHFAGRNYRMPFTRTGWESWQTQSAIRRALRAAGFKGAVEIPFLVKVKKTDSAAKEN